MCAHSLPCRQGEVAALRPALWLQKFMVGSNLADIAVLLELCRHGLLQDVSVAIQICVNSKSAVT